MIIRFILASLIAISLPALADDPKRTFPAGTYKQEGMCTKLAQLRQDQTGQCKPWLEVLVRQDDRPEFMFFYNENKYRVFVASGSASYAAGNKRITYQIGTVVDLESMRMAEAYGECALEILTNKEIIKCIAWSDSEKKELLLIGEFEGNGAWLYNFEQKKQ